MLYYPLWSIDMVTCYILDDPKHLNPHRPAKVVPSQLLVISSYIPQSSDMTIIFLLCNSRSTQK